MAGDQGVKSLSEEEDKQGAAVEKVDFDQTAAIKLVQEAVDAILQRDGSSNQQAIPDHEIPHSPGEHISVPAASWKQSFRERGEVVSEKSSLESEDMMHKVVQEGEALQEQKAESDERKTPGSNTSKSLSKLRKLIVTGKFIKAMEKLRKISPGKARCLSSQPTSEEERVSLRHMSMKERNNEEDWMLDFALRKVISRLSPDEQRRVALLVEAFETVTPDNKEKSIKCYPVKGKTAPGIELETPMSEETKQLLESQQEIPISDEQVHRKRDDEVPLYHKGIPEGRSLKEDHDYETSAPGDKILQEVDESALLLESSENCTTSMDRAFEEPVMRNEESTRTLEVPSQFPIKNSEVNPAGDMSTGLLDQQKYTSMWSMIYQHIVSREASMEGKHGSNGSDEEDQGGVENTSQETNDLDSIHSGYSTEHEADEDNQSASHEKHKFNQSAAIKLVKEAVNAILQRYEVLPDQQSDTDQNKATDDVKGLSISTPTNSTEESSRERDKRVVTCSETEVLEKRSDAALQQGDANESKVPHKKMSKSLSKLKKAIVTAKFIKAMEKLRKVSPQMPRHLSPEAALDEERVDLRHLNMDGRKNSEEWMLDYALRRVISRLAPDQQRRVAQLVEAFETITPEQKERTSRHYPLKDEHATGVRLANLTNKELRQLVDSEQQRSISDEKVPQKLDDRFLCTSEGIPELRNVQEDNDNQASTAVSNSASRRSENYSISAHVDVRVGKLSTGDAEEVTTNKVTSLSPTGDSEVGTPGDLTTILSNKQKYTSMWQLIYQHAVSSEASTAEKQRDNEVEEDEQDEGANDGQEMNSLDSTESSESTNQMVDENNQGAASKKHALDQSAAIKLVKEAISAILQCHEKKSNEKSLQEHDTAADSSQDICDQATSASTEENSIGWKRMEKHTRSKPEDKLHVEVNENAPVQKKAVANVFKTSHSSSSKSLSKLKKLFITAKFMKAMERMRRINPRQPRYMSPDAAPEEERVNLRHQDINERRNSEEWMLDYALRKVISNLAPEQQRTVALLVEAFETVTPEQKCNSNRSYMKAEWAPAIELGHTANGKQTTEGEHDNPTSYDDHICPNTGESSVLGQAAQLKRSQGVEHPTEISNVKIKSYEEVLDSDGKNLHVDHQTSSNGDLVGDPLDILIERKEADSKSKSQSLQQAYLSKDSRQDHEPNITEGIFTKTQKQTSMWHLIYQHAKSIPAVESGGSLSERVASKDRLKSGNPSSETTPDADAEDSDANSVPSELTESEAVKLVRDAINDILAVPQELDNRLVSSNITAVSSEDQGAEGFSKLRKLIICKKFIKAMDKSKMRKSYPQKQKNQILKSDPEAEKLNLKPCAVGEKKSVDELLLDNALQKVIAGLAPVQQRRVALLVEAFEKVNPDLEETGKRFCTTGIECLSSERNAKEKKDSIFESSQNKSQLPDGFNVKLQGSVPTSSKEVATESALEEIQKGKTPIICREDWRNNSPSIITAPTSDERTQSNDCKDPTKLNPGNMPGWRIQQEEITLVDEDNSEPAAETAEKPSQREDLEDEGSPSTENDMSLDKVRYTSPWHLLVQHVKHVNSDIFEETETQIPGEFDANATSDDCKDPIGINFGDMPGSRIQQEEVTSVDGNYSEPLVETAEKPSQPEDLEDERRPSTENDKSLDKVRHTTPWRLLVQHVNSDMFEETETQIPGEFDPNTTSDDYKDPTEINSRDKPGWCIQQEEVISVDGNYSEPAVETAEKPSQSEDLEDEGSPSTENDLTLDKVRHTSLWRLLVQHVNADIFEETETQIPGEFDADARVHRAHAVHELDMNDKYQLSSDVNHDEYVNLQMPKSKSFEFQEKEAIKVAQEALDAILTCEDQPTTTTKTSDHDSSENHGHRGEPSPATEEIEGVETLVDSVANPKEEQTPAKEKLSNSYSKLSKVILCRRFIKAIDKMKKLKPQSPQGPQLQSEEKIVHPMRQTASSQRKNWDEWMLDHAMQQVVGKLAPAQKKRVSLLVQAFETVSSQPEPGTGQKCKTTGL